MFLWWSTIEVDVFCPTILVVDATENSKGGGVAAEVYNPQTGLWFWHLCTYVYVHTTSYVHDQIYSAKNKKETTPWGQVSGWTCRTCACMEKFRVHPFKTAWTFWLLCGKHVTLFYCCSWGSLWYGIPGRGVNFRRLPWTRSYQLIDRNTKNRKRRCYNLSPVRHFF